VKEVKLQNVIGLLPGSDPVLKDTYVLVTAHYDHLGVLAEGKNSGIYYGANDDSSETASVIELASALPKLKSRPKRSIVFLAFFGEEKILLGSRFYARHLFFPLSNTVADINLEHLGRTDSSEGAQLSKLSFTRFDYSNVPATFQTAGAQTGIQVYRHDPDSDRWFRRSDNETLADMGVVAHTAHVTFGFPDYHKVGDQWQKIDYENMAKIDRAIALGILMIADNPEAPRWKAKNPKANRYFKASKLRPASLPARHLWPWYLTGCMGNR
jgi:Zn-dependent M28 family amino/carboxypeptidase